MNLLVSAFLLIGGSFVLIAAIGLVRLPDLLMRMHAATKAGTLGAGLLLAAVAVIVPGDGVAVKAIATVVFLLLTAPIASHVIARSAYHAGDIQLWDRTHVDELADDLARKTSESAADRRRAPYSPEQDVRPLSESAGPSPTLSA